MKLKYYIIGMIFLMLFLAGCSNTNSNDSSNNIADINDDPQKVTIYFFWGDGCPHCEAEKPFLESLEAKYSDVEVKMFETWNSPENANLFQDVAEAYGISAQGVPTTFIGDAYWVGYADYMGSEIETKVKECIETNCINPGDKLQ